MGKGKDDTKHSESALNHTSKPISALQNPSSFGPPPKHRDYYGEQAAAASIPVNPTIGTSQNREALASSRQPPPIPPAASRPSPANQVSREGQQQREESAKDIPSGPFKVDTTGLKTTGLPPPPQHRDKRVVETPARSPITTSSQARTGSPVKSAAAVRSVGPPPPPRSNVAVQVKGKPAIPPRVPPRTAVAGPPPL